MTDFDKRATIAASGLVLCDHLPDDYDDENWEGEDGETIDAWVVNNACEPYEYWTSKMLWNHIDSIAVTIKNFHKSECEIALKSSSTV